MEALITQTKSRQLRDILEKELLSGKYTVGSRFYSERKLAELFNTSHVTVREAVGTLVEAGFLTRTHGKGTFVTQPAPELSAGEVVGLVMPTTGHVFESFSNHLIRGLMAHKLFPLVIDLPHDWENGYRRTQDLIEKQPPFLVFDSKRPIPKQIYSSYKGHVIFIHSYEHEEVIPASYVLSDTHRGAMMAAEHLIESGYRRIIEYAYVDSYYKKKGNLGIDEGIKTVLKNRGLPESMFSCWLEGEGEKAIEERLRKEEYPVAVIAPADARLKPIYRMAEKIGLRIPEDLGLVGWYNTPWCETFRPHLTSVAIREDLMAEKVIEIITNEKMRGKKILIPPKLVIRGSTNNTLLFCLPSPFPPNQEVRLNIYREVEGK